MLDSRVAIRFGACLDQNWCRPDACRFEQLGDATSFDRRAINGAVHRDFANQGLFQYVVPRSGFAFAQ